MNALVHKYWAALTLLVLGAVSAMAAPVPVGRIAVLQYVSGSVSIQPRGTGNWAAAVPNQQVAVTDNVWTDKDARAEINVGTGTLRMNSQTSLTLANLDRSTVQLRLNKGTLHLHIHHLFGGEVYEVNSRNGVFTVTKSGDYRFDVDPKADVTTITVWKGEGTVSGERPVAKVHAHEQVRLHAVSAAYEKHKDPAPDGFDQWCRTRNKLQDRAYPYPYGYPYPPGVIVYGRPGPWGYVR